MNIEVNDKGIIELREVYGAIKFVTSDNEELYISMRDSGFEFSYQGKYYEAKEGKINAMQSSGKMLDVDIPTTNWPK